MAESILVALVRCLPGEEREFNAWYAEHIEEVLAVPGVRAVRRYRLSPDQAPGAAPADREYLAIYDLEGDTAPIVEELAARRAQGRWQPRRGIDESAIAMWAFERIANDGGPAA